jgi:hypothetical protein
MIQQARRFSPPFLAVPRSGALGGLEFTLMLFLLIALAADVVLLMFNGSLVATAVVCAAYILGATAFLRMSGSRFGFAEYLCIALILGIFTATLAGVWAGIVLSAPVGLGYLFAVIAGYMLYRNERGPEPTEAISPVAVASTAAPIPMTAMHDDALRNVDIFRGLSREHRHMIANMGRIEELRDGEILGVQGGWGDSIYVILDGQVQLLTSTPMGQLTVRIAGPGESLPLAALIGEGRLVTSAIALTAVRALTISRSNLLDLCAIHPDMGMQLFQAIAEVLATRYQSMLNRLGQSMDRIMEQTDMWANV